LELADAPFRCSGAILKQHTAMLEAVHPAAGGLDGDLEIVGAGLGDGTSGTETAPPLLVAPESSPDAAPSTPTTITVAVTTAAR
jgi:hypothetical protein